MRRLGVLISGGTEADVEERPELQFLGWACWSTDGSKAATWKLITVGVAVTPAGCGPMRQN